MNTAELAKKNLLRGLWTEEMIDALQAKGKLKAAEVVAMKSDLNSKLAEKAARNPLSK